MRELKAINYIIAMPLSPKGRGDKKTVVFVFSIKNGFVPFKGVKNLRK